MHAPLFNIFLGGHVSRRLGASENEQIITRYTGIHCSMIYKSQNIP